MKFSSPKNFAHAPRIYGDGFARAGVYRALEEFINLNLYNYDVKIGPTRAVR